MSPKKDNPLIQPLTYQKKDFDEIKKLAGPIFVIGASGFIGANMYYNLSAVRDDVYACSIDADNSWRLLSVPTNRKITLDVLDIFGLEQIVSKYKPRTVFNMSAYGAYSSQADAAQIQLVNYMGAVYLIEAMIKLKNTVLIQAGSSSEYGLNCRNSSENSELMPNSGYSVSKVAISYLLKYYGKIHDFPCSHLRFYSIYGPWEEKSRLIPTLIKHGIDGKFPPFTDKNISRDYVFVEDCVRACVRAALTSAKNYPGKAINVATGKKTTMEDIANISRKVFNIDDKIKPEFGSMQNRKWDLSEWYGDPLLAKRITKWTSRIDLSEGLELTARWQKEAERIFNG